MAVTVEQALGDHAEDIVQLLWDAEDWLRAHGFETPLDETSLADVREQTEAGEWYVAQLAGITVGAFRLQWSDSSRWLADAAEGAVVPTIAVDRTQVARGVGAELLGWAEAQAAARGVTALRVECPLSNSALRAYYERLGFAVVAEQRFEGWTDGDEPIGTVLMLLERPVEQAAHASSAPRR
ncbi:GNAT family N-acetyltransferase [Rhodococcus sp. HNM0569]|uniref:GNAT family N-acetyltransferase n=1 Tax=Rhodococcus sp. HNM0569 TaxID=2716340 RepID=UPI00146CAA67|nr:GNAT family N-acetyltransferase [Rhodococcus sp. HNM0569]NLU83935.1 GNAT family N-acetyltransferase [Rhodococcus sp. HNM0569]